MTLIGAAISPAFDGLFDTVGYAFLTIPALSGLFGTLLDIPFVAFTKFNNSVVMGSFLFMFLFTFWEDSLFISGVNMQQTLSVIQKLQRLSTKFL